MANKPKTIKAQYGILLFIEMLKDAHRNGQAEQLLQDYKQGCFEVRT